MRFRYMTALGLLMTSFALVEGGPHARSAEFDAVVPTTGAALPPESLRSFAICGPNATANESGASHGIGDEENGLALFVVARDMLAQHEALEEEIAGVADKINPSDVTVTVYEPTVGDKPPSEVVGVYKYADLGTDMGPGANPTVTTNQTIDLHILKCQPSPPGQLPPDQ